MADEQNRSPGFAKNPGYSIEIVPARERVRVEFNGEVVADSSRALLLHEQNHRPVYYFLVEDVAMALLSPTSLSTHCPYKGDASYWTITAGERTSENAVWGYREPFDEVAAIRGYLAFYRDRVDAWYEDGEPLLGRSH
jgi:uncharacterized protein (DUF427 family)